MLAVSRPEFEDIDVAVDGARGELHLNRPEKLNAISTRMLRELSEAAAWFDAQPELKVVVVSGRGRAFTGGADVSGFAESSWGAPPPVSREDADAGRRMADALERMTAVTLVKLHGACVGGGVVLAGACDIRVAAEDATFLIPEVDLGIPLAWGGIPRLVRDVGPVLTKELVMTCRPFSAAEALEAGFLNRVVGAEALERSVEELAASLASKPKLALLATKRHVNAVAEEMVGTMRSWSDADGLLAGLADPEGNQSALRYLARIRGERSKR
jgi:enoyl-CoA hydratase/carnithine racemase